ncbi:MAG: hypothetical protein ACI828_001354 [Flavobacteriales bacterium]|jgi:hypothetical protein
MAPYPFFLDLLYPIPLRHKKMFGVDAYYVEDKMMFALREKEKNPVDNGIWIATKKEHHQQLRQKLKGCKNIETTGIKAWLMLPSESDYFESDAHILAALIHSQNPLIGTSPKPKNRKSQR